MFYTEKFWSIILIIVKEFRNCIPINSNEVKFIFFQLLLKNIMLMSLSWFQIEHYINSVFMTWNRLGLNIFNAIPFETSLLVICASSNWRTFIKNIVLYTLDCLSPQTGKWIFLKDAYFGHFHPFNDLHTTNYITFWTVLFNFITF